MRSDNDYDGPVVTITCADETSTATAYHPFWVCRGDFLDERQTPRELKEHEDEGFSLQGRWVNSHELRAGDVLIDATGERRLVERLEQHYDPNFPVSNLTIQTQHTFAVGTQSILVHNTPGCLDAAAKRLGFDPSALVQGAKSVTIQIKHTLNLTMADIALIKSVAASRGISKVVVLSGSVRNTKLAELLLKLADEGRKFHGGVVEHIGDFLGMLLFRITFDIIL